MFIKWFKHIGCLVYHMGGVFKIRREQA